MTERVRSGRWRDAPLRVRARNPALVAGSRFLWADTKYERFEICAEEKGDGFYIRDTVRARRKCEKYVYHRMTAPKKMRVVLHLLKHLVEHPGEFMESVREEGWKDAFPQGQVYRRFKDEQILNPKEANGVFSNRWRFWTKKEIKKVARPE